MKILLVVGYNVCMYVDTIVSRLQVCMYVDTICSRLQCMYVDTIDNRVLCIHVYRYHSYLVTIIVCMLVL